MNLFIVDNIEDFENIKDPWNSLYASNPNMTAFQSWEFNFHWWSVNRQSGSLHIICIGNKKDLKFILPAYIENRNKTLKFLQTGSVDYLDALYSPHSQIHGYIKKTKEHIFNTSKIKNVFLSQLRTNSMLLNELPYYFNKEKYYIVQTDSYSVIEQKMMDSERFLKSIRSKQYKNLKRINSEIISNIDIIENNKSAFPFELIESILEKMAAHGIREKSVYHIQLEFMKKLYKMDKIFFIAQKKDNECISITCFVRLAQNRIMSWMALYDPKIKNCNLKNYLNIINYCLEQNYTFDLGTGIYPYKIQNFSPDIHSLFSFYFYKNRYKFIYYFCRKTVAKAFGII